MYIYMAMAIKCNIVTAQVAAMDITRTMGYPLSTDSKNETQLTRERLSAAFSSSTFISAWQVVIISS